MSGVRATDRCVHATRRWVVVIAVAVLIAVTIARPAAHAAAAVPDPCGPPVLNAVACENTLPGNPPSEWDVSAAGDPSIQGFATDISVNRGATVSFKVNTTARAYRLDIYRMGYYGGSGARRVDTVSPTAALPQAQPACLTVPATGLVDCGNWGVSASWAEICGPTRSTAAMTQT